MNIDCALLLYKTCILMHFILFQLMIQLKSKYVPEYDYCWIISLKSLMVFNQVDFDLIWASLQYTGRLMLIHACSGQSTHEAWCTISVGGAKVQSCSILRSRAAHYKEAFRRLLGMFWPFWWDILNTKHFKELWKCIH